MKGELSKMTFEDGVNPQQIEYVRRRLLVWRDEMVSETSISGETSCPADKEVSFDFIGGTANMVNKDASSQTSDDRKQKLISKIDETLHRIEAGTYGA
jgi:DnaK suppressor protein